MFCPKCATQNVDGAKFCRLCGADVSLVPQAMTGQISAALSNDEIDDDRVSRRRRRRGKTPSVEGAIKTGFMGMGFLFVAIALAFAHEGRGWWYWLLIPAFSMLGAGVAEYVRARNLQKQAALQAGQAQMTIPRGQQVRDLPPRHTSELVSQPPSITEGTTRHLGTEAPTKVFVPAEHPKQDG